MLIIQDKTLINIDNTFSVIIGGQGDRYLICKGSGSLETHLVFDNNAKAVEARDIIVKSYADCDKHCYINILMEEEIKINA